MRVTRTSPAVVAIAVVASLALSAAAKGQGLAPERASWTATNVIVSETPGFVSVFCSRSVKGAYTWRKSGSCIDRAGVLAGTGKKTG
jgi:hypothetical protein